MNRTCIHCGKDYSAAEIWALPLAKKHGGRVLISGEMHEYRVCTCGSHILLVYPRRETPPASIPVAAFAEANDARRR